MPIKNPSSPNLTPFRNESDSIGIEGLTIENRLDRVECYGTLTITRDKAGLATARALKEVLDAIVDVLSREQLPERIEERAVTVRKNPFA